MYEFCNRNVMFRGKCLSKKLKGWILFYVYSMCNVINNNNGAIHLGNSWHSNWQFLARMSEITGLPQKLLINMFGGRANL